ncbi:hypothetical protein PUN28_015081 [Cardiocondyla obscurior]|uniref:Uncharacterized protein n=1 Tax=Cardiocondyla obscurior TaxID=286306 RepID=A0AAW2F0F8_9HYME
MYSTAVLLARFIFLFRKCRCCKTVLGPAFLFRCRASDVNADVARRRSTGDSTRISLTASASDSRNVHRRALLAPVTDPWIIAPLHVFRVSIQRRHISAPGSLARSRPEICSLRVKLSINAKCQDSLSLANFPLSHENVLAINLSLPPLLLSRFFFPRRCIYCAKIYVLEYHDAFPEKYLFDMLIFFFSFLPLSIFLFNKNFYRDCSLLKLLTKKAVLISQIIFLMIYIVTLGASTASLRNLSLYFGAFHICIMLPKRKFVLIDQNFVHPPDASQRKGERDFRSASPSKGLRFLSPSLNVGVNVEKPLKCFFAHNSRYCRPPCVNKENTGYSLKRVPLDIAQHRESGIFPTAFWKKKKKNRGKKNEINKTKKRRR